MSTLHQHPGGTRKGRGDRQAAAARLSLLSNLFLVVIKIAAGFASGSISVLAEGIQSTMDVAASGVILLTVRAASAPPDPKHPYGHGKFENLASLGQMVLILGTTGYLLWAAWERWQNPQPIRIDWGIAALTVALVVNGLVSGRLVRVAEETGSQALRAEATHLRSDMASSAGVLVGLAAVGVTGILRLDPLIAGVMAVVVVVTAGQLLWDTVHTLADTGLPTEEEARVREMLEADPRVLGYHRLRTRQAGSYRLVDVHLLLDDDLSFREAHRVTEEVEGKIRDALPNLDIIVHAEPYEEEMRHQQERHGGTEHIHRLAPREGTPDERG